MRDIVLDRLFKVKDEKYREFHSGIVPGNDTIIGVRVPVLRRIAKDIARDNYEAYLMCDDFKYYEEKLLYGMIIGYARMPIADRFKYLDNFVLMVDNWAVCDSSCTTFKFTNDDLDQVWDYIMKYKDSSLEYELRFMIVMMLDYYLIDDYVDQVIDVVDNINSDYYYVKMAVAWLISVLIIKYEDKCLKYLANNHLDQWTYNKALQKILESYRVDKRIKDKIRGMKKDINKCC